ncbi:hypothetical protein JVT61DRAFT_1729 [Boletus reticuloceps]|uniref:Uncharacterized protein n=1 Tax=Boletus reticuloceps TaxID=495285 RepID=A0A8I2YSW0_9AGAM|nr:hypothetical protein JVT61DRAFT_1729 [Boletus reticuloceps]
MTTSIQLLPRLLQQVYNNGCAHAGLVNSGIQEPELKKAIPNRAFLNAINEYKSMVGDTPPSQVGTEPEDNAKDNTKDNTQDHAAGDHDGYNTEANTEMEESDDINESGDEEMGEGEFKLFPDDYSESESSEGEQADEWAEE